MLDAATMLLDSGGPEAVTLREVGRLAGVSHNAPYRHFADKRALLAAIAVVELETGTGQFRKVAAGELRLRTALLNYVRRALQYPERFRLMYSGSLQQDEILDRVASEARSALVDAVATAQKVGELPEGDPRKLGWLLLACAYGATIRALAEPDFREAKGATEAEELVEELFYHLGKDRSA